MLIITQVSQQTGVTTLIVTYTAKREQDSTYPILTIAVPESEVRKRTQAYRDLTGQQPTSLDVKNIVMTLIEEIRAGKQAFASAFDYSSITNVDLETAFDSPPPAEE